MKALNYIALSLVLLLTIACKTRIITPVVPEGDRVVLIEEFTGKGCTNCPKGSRELDNLLAIYGSQLVVVSIHAGFFANPQFFPLGQYDLRTQEGEQIFALLGPNLGYPSAVVNRKKFSGDYQHGANAWAGFVAAEITEEPDVEFTVDAEFDPVSRSMLIVVEGRARVDVGFPVYIGVMVTESGIIDAQDDQEAGGIVEDYEHKHVLRTMFTPHNGEWLVDNLNLGDGFSSHHAGTLAEHWDAARCEVVVFLARRDGGNLDVLQAGKVDVVP